MFDFDVDGDHFYNDYDDDLYAVDGGQVGTKLSDWI